MILTEHYWGRDRPFEGDVVIWLRSLPAGAVVKAARLTLEPSVPDSGEQFRETFVIEGDTGAGELDADDWGVTETQPGPFSEVDFHARRTLAAVEGTGGGATLQVDMGGAFVGVATDGTFKAPGDADWQVNLTDGTTADLPGLTTSKLRLTRLPANTEDLVVKSVTVRSAPTNINVRLGDMPPFWVRVGELATADTSPDFAAVLTEFLTGAEIESGFFAIPFVIHSDAIARLNARLEIEYVIEQRVLPAHLPEVTLPYGFSSLPGLGEDLLTVELPRNAIPVEGTGTEIVGTFESSRVVFGELGEIEGIQAVKVAAGSSLAQPIQVPEEVAATSIDLPLANTTPGLAGLHLALQKDADGKPSGEVLIEAAVKVEKPLPGQSSWGTARVPDEFRFLPGVRYWLVLQSLSGEAFWDAIPGAPDGPGLQVSVDGGLSWRQAGEEQLAAIFRLRHTPEHFSVPVQLQIGKGPDAVARRLDEFAPLGRIEFSFDFERELGDYVADPGRGFSCGTDELLLNGDFRVPPHDDATQRLFGFDAPNEDTEDSGSPAGLAGSVDLTGGVDLSIQRFIILSIDDDEPVRIDCAGVVPAKTTGEEIVAAINAAMGMQVAGIDTVLHITSPTSGANSKVQLHQWCRAQVPSHWSGDAGRVLRVRGRSAELPILVVLQSPLSLLSEVFGLFCGDNVARGREGDLPAEISQRVRVAAGCKYRLRFLATGVPVPRKGPVIGQSTAMTSILSYVSAGFVSGQASFRPLVPGRWEMVWLDADDVELGVERDVVREVPVGGDVVADYNHEAILTAPENATTAELRFIQEASGVLILGRVSLAPTMEVLLNGEFWRWGSMARKGDTQLPSSWRAVSGKVELEPGGVLLRGRGDSGALLPDDAVIAQRVDVAPGATYELRVHAWLMDEGPHNAEAKPKEQRPRAEVQWFTDGPVGSPVEVPLDGGDFGSRTWRGSSPPDATGAEIRVIQPRGEGILVVTSVSFSHWDQVQIPLTFLAEAPGELVVSDLRVAYDLPVQPSAGVTEESPLSRSTGFLTRRQASLGTEDDLGKPFGTSGASSPAITSLSGIGKKRAQRLANIGIDSMDRIAAASPADLAKHLGINLRAAAGYVKAARRSLTTKAGSPGK